MTDDDPLLSVRNLEKRYPITEGLLRRQTGTVRAVDGVSFDVRPGETLGIVGESGCGKSTTAHMLLRLDEPTDGEIRFEGENVLDYDDQELRAYRRNVQLVLQDPDSAFNPRRTIGRAVAEPLRVQGMQDADLRRTIVADALDRVGLGDADLDEHPHEFSGGEKQRLALARALVLNPDVIVADEPASALDGRTKAEVLGLLERLQEEFDLAVVLISHDISLVERFCDRIAVMYLGEFVERGQAEDVVAEPKHPYTRALVGSVPSLDPRAERRGPDLLSDEPPDASNIPGGCRFHPRCSAVISPDAVSLPRSQWLGAASLWHALDDGYDDADSVLDSLPPGSTTDDRLRDRFDLPPQLDDATVDTAVTDAATALDSGDLDGAADALGAVVEGVCHKSSPALRGDDREVACHRYDDAVPGNPLVGAAITEE